MKARARWRRTKLEGACNGMHWASLALLQALATLLEALPSPSQTSPALHKLHLHSLICCLHSTTFIYLFHCFVIICSLHTLQSTIISIYLEATGTFLLFVFIKNWFRHRRIHHRRTSSSWLEIYLCCFCRFQNAHESMRESPSHTLKQLPPGKLAYLQQNHNNYYIDSINPIYYVIQFIFLLNLISLIVSSFLLNISMKSNIQYYYVFWIELDPSMKSSRDLSISGNFIKLWR